MKKKIVLTVLACLLASLMACAENPPGSLFDKISAIGHRHEWGERLVYDEEENESIPCDRRVYYRICSGCRELKWEGGAFSDHLFTEERTEPTCVEEGLLVIRCEKCDYTEEQILEVLSSSHTFSDTLLYDGGSHWYECHTCGERRMETVHTFDEWMRCTVCDFSHGTEGVVYGIGAHGDYAYVERYDGTDKVVYVASTYGGLPVTEIGIGAFQSTDVDVVVLPKGVTVIQEHAFAGCEALEQVALPQGICEIADYAFSNCISLERLDLPDSLRRIGEGAFYGCTKLTGELDMSHVRYLGQYAFLGCSGVTGVTLGNELLIIGDGAFDGCTRLERILIGASTSRIGDAAFRGCYSLRHVFYTGDKARWQGVTIGGSNRSLEEATVYFYSEIQPTDGTPSWRYQNGNPTAW